MSRQRAVLWSSESVYEKAQGGDQMPGRASAPGQTPPIPTSDFRGVDQYESALITSPPPRVPSATKLERLTVLLMNRTEPSARQRLTPPGCRLFAEAEPYGPTYQGSDPANSGMGACSAASSACSSTK